MSVAPSPAIRSCAVASSAIASKSAQEHLRCVEAGTCRAHVEAASRAQVHGNSRDVGEYAPSECNGGESK
jgi:hypothetical protein